MNGRLARLQADNLLLNQALDAAALTNHALAPHAPLTVPTDPSLSSMTRNLRAPGSKRSSRRDDDDLQKRPQKKGRKEDYEIYGESGVWEREKAVKVFGASDDLGTADLGSIRKVLGVTRAAKAATRKR